MQHDGSFRMPKRFEETSRSEGTSGTAKALFKKVIERAKDEGDVWEKYAIHELPAERCRRHRFDMLNNTWLVDETLVKLETTPFDHGALRKCFRMKKLSQQPNRPSMHALSWKTANNYIAKQYIVSSSSEDDAKTKTLLDVKLQLTAGLLAQAFNQMDPAPPKSVIIIDCFAIELFEREPTEWCLVERFISGHDAYGRGFLKHNSNSGYVDDVEKRLTPHAFSAATFYLSKGHVIVCDVQGIDDLYTDPCLHSARLSFGDSDLGRRGMALFFHSYDCSKNPLFEFLGIPSFELCPSELSMCANAFDGSSLRRWNVLPQTSRTTQRRAAKQDSSKALVPVPSPPDVAAAVVELDKAAGAAVAAFARFVHSDDDEHDFYKDAPPTPTSHDAQQPLDAIQDELSAMIPLMLRRSSSQDSSSMDDEIRHIRDTSSPGHDRTKRQNLPTIENAPSLRLALAEVHAALAELQSEGRFTSAVANGGPALYHTAIAASLGSAVAAHAIGRWHAGLSCGALIPPRILEDIQDSNLAGHFFVLAAILGDAAAAFAGAEAFKSGTYGLIKNRRAAIKLLKFALSAFELPTNDKGEKAASPLRVGDIVEADYAAEGFWFAADIVAVSDDGRFVVHYTEDDEIESGVPRARIRTVDSEKPFYEQDGVDANAMFTAGNSGGELPPRHIVLASLADLEENTESAATLLRQAAEDAVAQAPALSSTYLQRADALEGQ